MAEVLVGVAEVVAVSLVGVAEAIIVSVVGVAEAVAVSLVGVAETRAVLLVGVAEAIVVSLVGVAIAVSVVGGAELAAVVTTALDTEDVVGGGDKHLASTGRSCSNVVSDTGSGRQASNLC